jgi:hypothetical protein
MIYNVLLISEQKLKDNTPINENVDSSELRFCIQMAQSIFLQESLGTNLYEHILGLVQNGDIDLAGNINYKELLNNFIQPMLIQYSYYYALDNFWVKFVNVGLQQYRSEQSNPISSKEFIWMKNNARDSAQFLDNLLRRHLVFNTSKFPQYTVIENNGQLIPEFGGAFKSPITLPAGNRILGNYGYYGCSLPWWYGKSDS